MHIEESYGRAKAVTTSDSATIDLTRGLYVGGAGNVVVTMSDGVDATFNSIAAGTVLKVAVQKVKTATTATNILALY